MSIMIALVGEQPEPVFLPARYLKPEEIILLHTSTTASIAERLHKNLSQSSLFQVDNFYDLNAVLRQIKVLMEGKSDVIFNLTGGTKIMSLAAFALAVKNDFHFIYFQSENNKSILWQYKSENSDIYLSMDKIEIPDLIDGKPLINIDEFLRLYLDAYKLKDFLDKPDGGLDAGFRFEGAIYKALEKAGLFEIKQNIIPAHAGEQIEIDMVVKYKNKFAALEIKSMDEKGESMKKGIDQLSTAASREYLGIYTTKILIIGRELNKLREAGKIKQLAREKNVKIIDLPLNWRANETVLDAVNADKLRKEITRYLSV
jgi:hypothetical protein